MLHALPCGAKLFVDVRLCIAVLISVTAVRDGPTLMSAPVAAVSLGRLGAHLVVAAAKSALATFHRLAAACDAALVRQDSLVLFDGWMNATLLGACCFGARRHADFYTLPRCLFLSSELLGRCLPCASRLTLLFFRSLPLRPCVTLSDHLRLRSCACCTACSLSRTSSYVTCS